MNVSIIQYRWEGKWGPFRIKSECEECDLTHAMIDSMMKKEFKSKDISFEVKPWLDNWPHCLARGAFHPPIIMIDGKKFHQFSKRDPLVNRKKLAGFVLSRLQE